MCSATRRRLLPGRTKKTKNVVRSMIIRPIRFVLTIQVVPRRRIQCTRSSSGRSNFFSNRFFRETFFAYKIKLDCYTTLINCTTCVIVYFLFFFISFLYLGFVVIDRASRVNPCGTPWTFFRHFTLGILCSINQVVKIEIEKIKKC